ncbi:MAG: MscS Mechanosensitive ion channel [Thermotoga sp. 50_1627]|uniref:mechanosensitive ion channel family protein n=1 Tax=Pseudothermotoga sp. TaxID=2033661 RepID=UPI00076C24E9|nr:MAG: MscS Mechanosensitive ion channel [Thermotoga sp. 50_64]KUK25139.1 MAG: MscS Mechanosensitive ion channel [Thermotoga sp. 50_1627]MDK2923753.1 small conductance mechanosensitive channel [Pseudothermotoga sp.]
MAVIVKLIKTAITVAVAYGAYRLLYVTILRGAEKLGKELRLKNTLRIILLTIASVIALMVILDIWQVNLLPYLTALGIGGIAVGLAIQEPLSNFISGLLVILTGKLRESDVVEIDGITGIVEVVNYNHTVLRTFDGKHVLVPNKQVWNQRLTNYWPTNVRRFTLKVSVSYGSDLEKVLEILTKCIEEEPLVEKSPERSNSIVFAEFGPSSIDFNVNFWVQRQNYFDAFNSLANRIKRELEANGIVIPFPQLDVHIKERAS